MASFGPYSGKLPSLDTLDTFKKVHFGVSAGLALSIPVGLSVASLLGAHDLQHTSSASSAIYNASQKSTSVWSSISGFWHAFLHL